MVRAYKQEHVYKHPWERVTASSWRKFSSYLADSGKFGDSDCFSIVRTTYEDDLDVYERIRQVPDIGKSGFKVPSLPTASDLFWPSTSQEFAATAHFVLDISIPDGHYSYWHCPRNGHANT